jgi:hypothetical protein
VTFLFRAATIIAVVALVQMASAADQLALNQPNPIAFDLPAECRLGETCWIVNYVDVEPSEAAQDFQCHARTYDGHDGVDLAIRDRGVMERGVPVVAAAAGTVRRVRDGVSDVGISHARSREAIVGRGCGNGVVIDHGHGWETQYCHLKQHRLRVTVGQQFERGSEVGLIGLSGKTEFPHVHLTVRHHGETIDPFTGQSSRAGCGRPSCSLWRDPQITYEDVALYQAGFSVDEPQPEAIRKGGARHTTISADSAAMVLWVDIFGVEAEDRLRFRITAPDGRIILDRQQRIQQTQARRFGFAGVRRGSLPGQLGPTGVNYSSGEGTMVPRSPEHASSQWRFKPARLIHNPRRGEEVPAVETRWNDGIM